MNIPYEWLNEYVDLSKKKPENIAKSFTMLGLLLDKPYENGIFNLEHRMDRSDWLSIIGCARDLAAFDDLRLKFPELYKNEGNPDGGIKIEVKCPKEVNRFNTRVFKNIEVKESPDWLKTRLETYGIPSKNNIVDITNYVMVELGQPMHAQDIDKMEKPEIVIRYAKDGEEITTLLGEKVKLDSSMFVLTQNNKPTVIGGIVGGNSTGVDFNTTNIVLDAGNYNQNSVRKSSRKLKIQNETVLRYDKFLHPELTQVAIERATRLILDLAGGEFYQNYDYYPNKMEPKIMRLRMSRVKLISGLEMDLELVKSILQRLEYKILDEDKNSLEVEIPYFRTDVEVEDDLVADVLRINSYAKIPTSPISSAPPKDITSKEYLTENKIREALLALGLHEHITDPLVKKQSNNSRQVVLENALTSDKGALRSDIYSTLFPVVKTYKKHGKEKISLFEIGMFYETNKHKFTETRALEIVHINQESIKEQIHEIKKIINGMFYFMGIKNVNYTKTKSGIVHIFANNIQVGELKKDSATIFTTPLSNIEKEFFRVTDVIPNNIEEDITFYSDMSVEYGPIVKFIKQYDESINDAQVVSEYLLEDVNKKSITIRVSFDTHKGATTESVDHIRNELLNDLLENFGISTKSPQ